MDNAMKSGCFPWEKLDDLILFALWAVLIIVFIAFGDKGTAGNLMSGLAGAMGMYLKGSD